MSNLTIKNQENSTARYIAIEGGIGVGKTTLANALAKDLSANLLLEPENEVSFLSDFYQDMRCYAFSTQMSFLIHRIEQFNTAIEQNLFKGMVVSDYCWDKEYLFAKHNLNTKEYQLYQSIIKHLDIVIPKPDLVVYLQAPIKVLQQRIAKRNKNYEQNIDDAYLLGLCQKYAEYFHNYSNSALLIVNAGNIDWVNYDKDYQVLKQYINKIHNGKHFLNFESEV